MDIRKQIELLKKEYDNNIIKIKELDEKVRTINANSFSTRTLSVVGFSVIAWFILILLIPAIVNLGVIPLTLIQPLSIILPVTLGLTCENGLAKKYRLKERLQSFSKAKSEKDKLIDEVNYSIELERIKSSNKVIEKVIEKLEDKEKMLNTFAEEYDINLKAMKDDNDNQVKRDILLKELKDLQKEIDHISTKIVLKNKFWRIREKFQILIDSMMYSMFGCVIALGLFGVPYMAINLTSPLLTISNTSLIIALVAGGLLGESLAIKKLIDQNWAFNNVNSKLGSEELSSFSKDSDLKRHMENDQEERFDLELASLIDASVSKRLEYVDESLKMDYLNNLQDNKVDEVDVLDLEEKEQLSVDSQKGKMLKRV